jgi:hypothetical protein
MCRALTAGLLLTPVLLAAPVPKDGAVRMNRAYGTPHDPDKGAEFRPVGDALRVALPHTPRLLGPWCGVVNAPRVWREVRGDFTATVRVSFPVRPRLPAKHDDVPESRAGGGLVVWLDADNFLTVTRDERECAGEPGEFYRLEMRDGGKAKGYAEYTDPRQAGYLRARRTGKQIEGSYSTDGKKWKVLALCDAEWAEHLKVGVVAENSYKAPFDLTFDEYALAPAKP